MAVPMARAHDVNTAGLSAYLYKSLANMDAGVKIDLPKAA
jgi:hypothetical protein